MRATTIFLCKRMFHRKSNCYLLLGTLAVFMLVFVMNMKTQDRLRDYLVQSIETQTETMEEYREQLANATPDSLEYELCADTLETAIASQQEYRTLLGYLDEKAYGQFYSSYLELLKNDYEQIETSYQNGEGAEIQASQLQEIAYIDYLHTHQLAYEDRGYPIFGLSYLTSLARTIAPILLLICCCYLLSQVFTLHYEQGIDLNRLLPMERKKTFFLNLLIGIAISLLLYMVLLGCAFLLATLVSGNSGFAYPYFIKDGLQDTIVPVTSFFFSWGVLGMFYFLFICLFLYLLSFLIKEEGPLFFTSLTLLLGMAFLPNFLSFLQPITPYLPTTYLHFIDIVNGTLALQYQTVSLNVATGMHVLTISILLLGILCFLLHQIPLQYRKK